MDSFPIIFWIFFSVVSGYMAYRKGQSFLGFFFSPFLSPIIGVVAALLAAPNSAEVKGKRVKPKETRKWVVVAMALVAAAGCSRQELRGATPGQLAPAPEASLGGVAVRDAQAPEQSGGSQI